MEGRRESVPKRVYRREKNDLNESRIEFMENLPQEILDLLRSKSRCLDRLMAETRTFLAAPIESLVVDTEGKSGPLSIYEEARASIIGMLEAHDRTIGELVARLAASERTPNFIAAAREEMLRNERLIVGVFNADDVVFRKIGEAQNQILKLIQENRKSRDLLGKFKSAPASTGEGMDTTL